MHRNGSRIQRTVGILAITCAGCSGKSDSNPDKSPTGDRSEVGSVTVYLEPVDGLPRLQMRVAFFEQRDPNPHVQPLATALIGARQACYQTGVAPGTADVRVEISDRKLRASPRNPLGDCLAKALDGKPIDDAESLVVDLHVTAQPGKTP